MERDQQIVLRRGNVVRKLASIALVAGLSGAIFLAVASRSPDYVDASGFIVEPFAWIASGSILLLMSAVIFIITVIFWAAHSVKCRLTRWF